MQFEAASKFDLNLVIFFSGPFLVGGKKKGLIDAQRKNYYYLEGGGGLRP